MREFVQLPMNTTSTVCPSSGWPGVQTHVSERLARSDALSGTRPATAPGSGTVAVTGMPMPGIRAEGDHRVRCRRRPA